MRRAASWCQPWQRRAVPRGAWMAVFRLIAVLVRGPGAPPELPTSRTWPGGWRGPDSRYRWIAGDLRRATERWRGRRRARGAIRDRDRKARDTAGLRQRPAVRWRRCTRSEERRVGKES